MSEKGYHVAVVGATGAVGQKIIELLEKETKFNIAEVTLLSSKRSAGKTVQFKGREIISPFFYSRSYLFASSSVVKVSRMKN